MVRDTITRPADDFINGHPVYKQDQYEIKDLMTILGKSRATIYAYIKNKEFPLPMRKRRHNDRQYCVGADLLRWHRAYA